MKKYTTYWIKHFKQDKKFGHLRFKLLKDKRCGGYPPFDIDKSLVDKVKLEDFVKIEDNRIPFFLGTQCGIYPRIEKIPNFYNGLKIIAKLGKSLLSGHVAGLSIYEVYKDDKREWVLLANFENISYYFNVDRPEKGTDALLKELGLWPKIDKHKPKKVYTLLCVDDDALMVEALSGYFTNQGYETFTASSAEEALEVLSKHHIDLVMTDVMMPGMNGLELTKIIKKNCDSYVIIFTGYKPNCSYEKAIALGASDFFYKPFKFEDLLGSVKKILDKIVC